MEEKKTTKQELKKQAMLNGPVKKTIIRMAIPTIVSFLISSIYSLADTYFVSGIGTNATAAVSVNASLDQIIFMMGSMLAVGGNSYIARLLGAKDEKKANQVLSTSFFTAIFLGTAMMILGILFMHPLVRLLGATPTCEQYSIEYATYVLLVAPIMASSFVLNHRFHSETDLDKYMEVKMHEDLMPLFQDVEELSVEDLMEEFMYLGLRMTEGVSGAEFFDRFGRNMFSEFDAAIRKNVLLGLLEVKPPTVKLTDRGLDLSNRVFADFYRALPRA